MHVERFMPARRTALVFFAAFLLAAVVLGLRFPDRIFDPQMRDEDGYIFFRQDGVGGIEALTILYAGYLHTLQRLVAFVAGFFHPRWAPWVYNWATFLITAAICGRIAIARIPAGWRLGFIALLLLHPFCLWNAIHLTNLFWFTAALFPIFAIERAPAGGPGKIATIGAAALLGLSGPFSIFFAPLFALRLLLLDRSRYAFDLAATVAITGLAQAFFLLKSPRFDVTTDSGPFVFGDIWTLANRFVVKSFFVKFADESSVAQSVAAFLVLALFIAGAVVALRRRLITRDDGCRIAMLLAGAGLMYLAGIFGTLGPWRDVVPGGMNSRYYILPWLLFGWAVVALAWAPGARWTRIPAAALVLLAPLTVFRADPFPPSTWAKDVRRVEREGYGMLRLHPAGEHRHLFLARGNGRHGFARGADLGKYHSLNVLLPRVFRLHHAASASLDAPVFAFLHNLGNREGLITFPRSRVGLVIPEGAGFFQGTCGFAPLAVPPNSLDGFTGGDGILFRIRITDAQKESRLLLQKFLPPALISDPAARHSFRIEIPPGPWRVLFIENLQGATDGHSTLYDFALWTDLAFLRKQ